MNPGDSRREDGLLRDVYEAAEKLLNAGTFTNKDGTVWRSFIVPSEARDDLEEACDALRQLDTDES